MQALPKTVSVRIEVLVGSNACGDEVLGWAGGALKIRVAASARNGEADAAVEALLAEILGLPRSRVSIAGGRGSSRKLVEIRNLDELTLDSCLPGRQETSPVASSDGSLSAPSVLKAVATK